MTSAPLLIQRRLERDETQLGPGRPLPQKRTHAPTRCLPQVFAATRLLTPQAKYTNRSATPYAFPHRLSNPHRGAAFRGLSFFGSRILRQHSGDVSCHTNETISPAVRDGGNIHQRPVHAAPLVIIGNDLGTRSSRSDC